MTEEIHRKRVISAPPSDVENDIDHYNDPDHRAERDARRRGLALFNSRLGQEVVKIIVDQLGVKPEEVEWNSSFVDDLGAGSLDVVEIIMALEDKFDMEIPDGDAAKITAVWQALEYIESHQ